MIVLASSGAASLNTTEQVKVVDVFEVGEQLTFVIRFPPGWSLMEVVCEAPLNDAAIVAIWSAVILPAVALNVAVVDPEATDTEAGTLSAAALLESATAPPLLFDSATVQAPAAPLPRVAGEQFR
ncbi:MAG TPA: hypothetical protein VLJ39_11555, partial [Tepidisphaeraceae bacterium]|nr:hypothetical protein [Tepidisphaeraceae bacterium]